MRVPDIVLKSAVFLGLDSPTGKEYGGTGYIISVDYGPGYVFTSEDAGVSKAIRYPLMFLATAAHVAEKLEGVDFYIRANRRNGSLAEIKVEAETTRWWYHATEKDAVDAALVVLPIGAMFATDMIPIPVTGFVSEEIIGSHNLGIGDEVFVAGLFKNAKGTSKNIPIIRIGNVAMMPGEKIFFPTEERPDQWLYANLLESRSTGGLSGSPVFIRETVSVPAGFRARPGFALNAVNSPTPEEIGLEKLQLAGVGRFYFFGSMIGHWRVQTGFPTTREEAVNMGIAPMVPAHKILEIFQQPELINLMNTLHAKKRGRVEQLDGIPTLDDSFGKAKGEPLTKEEFETVLKKVSRRKSEQT